MKLAWGARVPEWFRNRAIAIAAGQDVDPSDLMACMYFESKLNPEARNPNSSASGLIQFMTDTAVELGTTIEAIRAMTAMEQLELVGQYFAMRQEQFGKIKDLASCYMAILFPKAIPWPDDAVIFPAGSKAYLANKGLDIDHDNEVTKGEAAAFVVKALALGLQPGNVFDVSDTQPAAPIEDRSTREPVVQPEKPMGALLMPLLMSIVGKFINPTVAQNVTSIVTKDGQQSTAAQSLLNTLLSAVAGQAGTTPAAMQADDRAAIAAVAAVQADTAKMKAVEDAAGAHLNAVMPFVQQLAVLDQMRYDAENKGKQTVSSIAIAEHAAGIWDMTKTVVLAVVILLGIVSVGLLAAILVQALTGTRTIDSGLIGLAGPIWTGTVVSGFVAIIAYRFDGTKNSNAATKAMRATERFREETGK